MIQMLRLQAMRQLTDALDRAVATNAALSGARQILLQPLKMLEAFGQEVPAALANQPAALDRLRLLLQSAASAALETKRAFESPSAQVASQNHHPRPCEGAVIKMGGLVVAGLAAGVVGRRMSNKLGDQMIDVVHGVALAASPAESLARSLQNGLSADQVAAALDGLGGGSVALTRISAMAPVFLDACERARWECLRRLFETVKEQSGLEWEGSASVSVVDVQRAKKGHHPVLTVQLAGNQESAALLAELEKKDAVGVLSSSNGCMAVAVHVEKKDRRVTLPLPPGARAGWIGFATRERRRAAICTREEVVKYWQDAERKNECLRGAPVPVEVIAPNDDEGIYPPPPLSAASWGVRILDAAITRDGAEATLVVSLSRAEEAKRVIAKLDGIEKTLTLTLDGSEASVIVQTDPSRALRGVVTVYGEHRSDPDDERGVSSPAVEDGATEPEVPSGGDGTGGGDSNGHEEDGEPIPGTSRRYVAIVRPVFVQGAEIQRVSAERLPSLKKQLAGVALIEELPFVRDEDLMVKGTLGDLRGPAGTGLLERLAILAAQSSGLEEATLLALVPSEVAGSSTDFVAARGDGAAVLAVGTPDGAEANITPVVPSSPLKTERLRLAGRISRDDIAVTEPLRKELRGAGPGAPFLTPFVAVALNGRGEAHAAVRIRVMNASRSGAFATFVPVMSAPEAENGPDSTASVELRFQPETLAVEMRAQAETVFANLASIDGPVLRTPLDPNSMIAPLAPFGRPARGPLPVLSKPSGGPEIQISELTPAKLRWSASHSRGVRLQLEIEVGRRRADGASVWTRLESFGTKRQAEEAELGLERPLPGPGIDQVRIFGSDGWNAEQDTKALSVKPGNLRIRALDAARYWLDLARPSNDEIAWEIWQPEAFPRRPPSGGTSPGAAPGVAALAATGAAGAAAPERQASSKIGKVFQLLPDDAGKILRACFAGEEDFLVVPPVVRA